MIHPILRLQRVRQRRAVGEPPDPEDAGWLADACLRAIDAGTAPLVEMGIARHGGAGGPAIVQQRAARDAMIRELYRRFFSHLEGMPAARAIKSLFDARSTRHSVPTNRQETVMDDMRARGLCLPTERRIADILHIQDELELPSLDIVRAIVSEG